MPRSDLEDEEDYQHKEIQEEELPSNQKRELLLALEVKKVKLTPFLNARDHHVEKGGGAEQRCSERLLARKNSPQSKKQIGIIPPIYKGSCTLHRSVGDSLLCHQVPQLLSCLPVCSKLFLPLEFCLKTFLIKI